MITRLTLHTLLAALLVGAAAFAWQAENEGAAVAAARLAAVLGLDAGEDD